MKFSEKGPWNLHLKAKYPNCIIEKKGNWKLMHNGYKRSISYIKDLNK